MAAISDYCMLDRWLSTRDKKQRRSGFIVTRHAWKGPFATCSVMEVTYFWENDSVLEGQGTRDIFWMTVPTVPRL